MSPMATFYIYAGIVVSGSGGKLKLSLTVDKENQSLIGDRIRPKGTLDKGLTLLPTALSQPRRGTYQFSLAGKKARIYLPMSFVGEDPPVQTTHIEKVSATSLGKGRGTRLAPADAKTFMYRPRREMAKRAKAPSASDPEFIQQLRQAVQEINRLARDCGARLYIDSVGRLHANIEVIKVMKVA